MGARAGAWLVVLLVGCGGPAAEPAPDGGAPPGIAPAADPVLTPCPEGWTAIAEEGVVHCEPWATGGAIACEPGEIHVPGRPACERLGPPCPADGWPADLPVDRPIVFVDDDAAPGGDGSSRDRALARPGDATILAPEGAVIALAAGRYDGAFGLSAGQTLIGACAADTILTSSVASEAAGVLTLTARAVSVRNVSIVDPARAAIVISGGDATIDDVTVRGAQLVGLYVANATVTARGLAIEDTAPTPSGIFGRGIQVQEGAQAVLERVSIVRSREAGIAVVDAGSIVEARDVAVHDTEPGASGAGGMGILVEGGAELVLARAAIEGNTQDGLLIHEGAVVDAEDVVVRGTRSDAAGDQGIGAHVEDARLTLRRARIAANRKVGIFVAGATARLEASALLVRDTATLPDGTMGRGVEIAFGATASLTAARFERNTEVSVFVAGPGTSLDASDLVIVDTHLHGAGLVGRALGVEDGASATVLRARVERSHATALFASRAGSSLEARDVVVRDTRPTATGSSGRAVNAQYGARLIVERAILEDSTEASVYARHEGTRLEVRDAIVRRTRPDAAGLHGIGVWAQDGAGVILERVDVLESRTVGVGARAATITGTELRVVGVLSADCGSGCGGLEGGFGVTSHGGAVVSIADFELADLAVCGVVVATFPGAPDTSLDLARGVVRGAPVGACVQIEGYDAERLRRDVRFEDVDVPLQATSYGLPDALPEG